MNADPPEQKIDAHAVEQRRFVDWLRTVAPYIHAFRNKAFVVAFGGELVQFGALNALIQDLAFLHAMGIRIVLVHGSQPQVEEQLRLHQIEALFSNGTRITDARALLKRRKKRPVKYGSTLKRPLVKAYPTPPWPMRASASFRAILSPRGRWVS